jgi:Domain of unknown function (DUF4209)
MAFAADPAKRIRPMHRYPEKTATSGAVAIVALQSHPEALSEATDPHELWQSLSGVARKVAEANEPDWPTVKALWLMADACSMMLRGDSANDPFGPIATFGDRRSAVPEDFGADDALLFSEVAASTAHRVLQARLADMAWFCARPKKDIADAHRAIDAYRSQLPTEDNWFTVQEEWRRAITLCMQLRKGAGDRLEKIDQELQGIAEAALPLDGSLGLPVATMLFDRHLARDQGEKFAELLAARGTAMLATAVEFFSVRAHVELAARWFERLEKPERVADMLLNIALSWEADTDLRLKQSEAAGHLVAGTFLEDAIQTLRKIPKEQRAARGVDGHLERLQRRLNESGEQALKGMKLISTGPIDVTEFIEKSQAAVRGKAPLDALVQLAHLHVGARIARMTEQAEKSLRTHPLSALFSASHYGRDGRVIAKTPGGDLAGDSAQHEANVWSTIMRNYQMDIDLVCNAQLLPALAVIREEHTLRRSDLVQLMHLSPVIPPGRAEQFAKGFWEGFEDDWASAIYVLAPQVEHLVRWHLKQAGVKTTNLDAGGIENEVGLSSLIEAKEIKTIFGDDLAFELEALFCTAFGPNLRNEVAHGLLSAQECRTSGVVYAWWWLLRLTLRSFVLAQQKVAPSQVAPAAPFSAAPLPHPAQPTDAQTG